MLVSKWDWVVRWDSALRLNGDDGFRGGWELPWKDRLGIGLTPLPVFGFLLGGCRTWGRRASPEAFGVNPCFMKKSVEVLSKCCHYACMATLTIRNVPEDLHEALKERARVNRRSVNQEVISELSLAAGSVGADATRQRWERANALADDMRGKMTTLMTADEIRAAIEEGRR